MAWDGGLWREKWTGLFGGLGLVLGEPPNIIAVSEILFGKADMNAEAARVTV